MIIWGSMCEQEEWERFIKVASFDNQLPYVVPWGNTPQTLRFSPSCFKVRTLLLVMLLPIVIVTASLFSWIVCQHDQCSGLQNLEIAFTVFAWW